MRDAAPRVIQAADTRHDDYRGQILKHGKRLIGSDELYARLLTRHLIDEADFMPYYRRVLAERRQAWIGRR